MMRHADLTRFSYKPGLILDGVGDIPPK